MTDNNTPTSNETTQTLIESAMPKAKVIVNGDGYKYEVTIIDSAFEGLGVLARHKLVYKALDEEIASGRLHALTIIAKTPQEMEAT